MPFLRAVSFITGSMPGNPIQIGHTFVLGIMPKESVLHEQNIFDCTLICACISKPITVSKSDITPLFYHILRSNPWLNHVPCFCKKIIEGTSIHNDGPLLWHMSSLKFEKLF